MDRHRAWFVVRQAPYKKGEVKKTSYSFGLPEHIGKVCVGKKFIPVLVEEGVLFKLVEETELPSWATKKGKK